MGSVLKTKQNFWSNLKIKYKLGILVGLMGLLMIGVLFLFNNTLNDAVTAFKDVQHTESTILLHAKEINNYMLQCRRNEKDFFLRKDKKYLGKLNKNVAAMVKEAKILKNIADYANLSKASKQAQDIINNADIYQKGFAVIVASYEKKGLDHKSGLQGAFRGVVHKLSEKMKEHKKSQLQIELLTLRKHEKDYLLRLDKKYVVKAHKTLDKLLSEYNNSDFSNEDRNNVENLVQKYRELFDALVKADEHITKVKTDMRNVVHKIEPIVANLSQEAEKLSLNKIEATEIKASKKAMLAIIIGIIAVISGQLAGFLIARTIINAITETIDGTKKIAQGDLTHHININQKDEVGILALSMNTMCKNLQTMFGDISNGINTLTASSAKLSDVSDKITDNSEVTAEKSNTVSAAAEELSSNMNSVAAATEQATANIQMIVAGTEEMTSTIQEIAGNMAKGSETTNHAVEKAQEVSTKVDELGKAASQINKVTETIADISEQTNLLALNATIEAARAGEAGKGFAVVAGEIKALAQQTAEATTEISDRISSVQTTTDESVKAIEIIVKVINDINEIVTTVAAAIEEQSATTQEISTNVSQAALGIQEVNENVNQASAVTGEVTKDITDVSHLAQETNSESFKIDKGTTELSKLADKLNEMVSRFKI